MAWEIVEENAELLPMRTWFVTDRSGNEWIVEAEDETGAIDEVFIAGGWDADDDSDFTVEEVEE